MPTKFDDLAKGPKGESIKCVLLQTERNIFEKIRRSELCKKRNTDEGKRCQRCQVPVYAVSTRKIPGDDCQKIESDANDDDI